MLAQIPSQDVFLSAFGITPMQINRNCIVRRKILFQCDSPHKSQYRLRLSIRDHYLRMPPCNSVYHLQCMIIAADYTLHDLRMQPIIIKARLLQLHVPLMVFTRQQILEILIPLGTVQPIAVSLRETLPVAELLQYQIRHQHCCLLVALLKHAMKVPHK